MTSPFKWKGAPSVFSGDVRFYGGSRAAHKAPKSLPIGKAGLTTSINTEKADRVIKRIKALASA